MAVKCDVCGKKTMHGNQHLHRHSRWRFRAPKTKRTWVPNLRDVKIVLQDGKKIEIKMCMSCYKRYTKDGLAFLKRKGVI